MIRVPQRCPGVGIANLVYIQPVSHRDTEFTSPELSPLALPILRVEVGVQLRPTDYSLRAVKRISRYFRRVSLLGSIGVSVAMPLRAGYASVLVPLRSKSTSVTSSMFRP